MPPVPRLQNAKKNAVFPRAHVCCISGYIPSSICCIWLTRISYLWLHFVGQKFTFVWEDFTFSLYIVGLRRKSTNIKIYFIIMQKHGQTNTNFCNKKTELCQKTTRNGLVGPSRITICKRVCEGMVDNADAVQVSFGILNIYRHFKIIHIEHWAGIWFISSIGLIF